MDIESESFKVNIEMDIYAKIRNKTARLNDLDNALKDPDTAVSFYMLNIPGTDFDKCLDVISGKINTSKNQSYIDWCSRKIACYAFDFARKNPGIDTERYQKAACLSQEYAFKFARFIPGADVEYCRKACEKSEYWTHALNGTLLNLSHQEIVINHFGAEAAYLYAEMNISGTDIERLRDKCRGDVIFEEKFDKKFPKNEVV